MPHTLEGIWEQFAARLRGFIRSRIGDHSAAEDVLQEVFVKIHGKLPTLRNGEHVDAWVWRITRNAIVDHVRRVRPHDPLPEELKATTDREVEMPDLSPCIRRFVSELPLTYREALVLTEWEGLTQKQMARRLGLSLSGAKSRVQRARGQLKEMLVDCCRLELDRRGNVVKMKPKRKQCAGSC